GGVLRSFYPPCEWGHKQFWDGGNCSRGAKPPRSQWKAPPQRPIEETEAAFARFSQYIDHIKSLGVKFVTASELSTIYPDKVRSVGATEDEVREIAEVLASPDSTGIDFLVINENSLSTV